MIKAVRSDHDSFKNIYFNKWFNVVIAERTKHSSEKDSRNGLGKTTLLEIIHFCLGSSVKEGQIFKLKELNDWTFILDITLRGNDYTIYRNTSDISNIFVEGNISDWPIKPEYSRKHKAYILKDKEWSKILGYLMFDLPIESESKYSPTFRSLISYFIRRGVGGFEDPFKHYSRQMEWDIQVNNSYLLGLNTEYASDFQVLKDKSKVLDNLKNAAKQGLLRGFIGSLGEMKAEKVRLEMEVKNLEEQLISFKVHPQYYKIQEEADLLKNQIATLINQYNINKSLLKKYTDSIAEEQDIPLDKVIEVYRESGIIFPKDTLNNIDSVLRFHKTIIENRKHYLQTEIERINRELNNIEKKIEFLSNKKAELMSILNTHGALQEFEKLQGRLISLKEQLEDVIKRIDNLSKFEEGKTTLKIEKQELIQKARRDLYERNVTIEEVISIFNKNSQYLYSEPGILSIDLTDSGYKFNIEIKRSRSQGIGCMKIFCYDLTLAQIRSKYKDMPGFLIHDSTIFDAVDERQIAKSLELAAKEAEERGFQYICTLNTDRIPYNDFSDEFREKFNNFIVMKFTDATNDGGLLGIRF